jgi:hypothetical protein
MCDMWRSLTGLDDKSLTCRLCGKLTALLASGRRTDTHVTTVVRFRASMHGPTPVERCSPALCLVRPRRGPRRAPAGTAHAPSRFPHAFCVQYLIFFETFRCNTCNIKKSQMKHLKHLKHASKTFAKTLENYCKHTQHPDETLSTYV